MHILYIAIALFVLIFNPLKLRTGLWWLSIELTKALFSLLKWTMKRRKERKKAPKEEVVDTTEPQQRQQSKEPKKPKFFVAKFCKNVWQAVHKDDKDFIKKDPIANVNFRLGVMHAVAVMGDEFGIPVKIDEVMERMEDGKF